MFGKDGKNSNLINNSVMFGLNAGGSYETKQINLDYFIDPSILNNKKSTDIVTSFLTEIIINQMS